MAMLIWQCIFIYFKHFTHLFPNTQIMQFQCDDIWRRVDQLNFRFGDELTSRPRRRDDQGDELTCNRLALASRAICLTKIKTGHIICAINVGIQWITALVDYGPSNMDQVEKRPMLNAAHIFLQNPRTDVRGESLFICFQSRSTCFHSFHNKIMYNMYI